MRGLGENFLYDLKDDFLASITKKVQLDKDLDLQIREKYINVYYKGNSLLKLTEISPHKYGVEVHKKFLENIQVPNQLIDLESTSAFLKQLPQIKENIITYGSSSIEAEYEQLVIRANNLESKNNSDYYMLDRQYTTEKRDRFDLTGFYWDRAKRSRGQQVPLCFIELKFALNPDIKNIHEQIERYYKYVKDNSYQLADETQRLFQQKLQLNLLNQPIDRMDALKTLTFSTDVNEYEFILLLVDYNPNSSLLNLAALRRLPFASQIKIFRSGFGIWENRLEKL